MLTRADLIKPKTKTVEVDGGSITIRTLTAGEALEFRGKDIGRAEILTILAKSICEPELAVEDVALIPAVTMNKIVVEVFAFNAMGDKAVEEAQAELKKTKP